MWEVPKSEQIYLQRCKLQESQEVSEPIFVKLLQKYRKFKEAMENKHETNHQFDWFYLEDFLSTDQTVVCDLHKSYVCYKFMMPSNNS